MRTVMVSIGRNIGNEPMSRKDWLAFVNDASDAIRAQGESPEFHFGTGIWDGISEESVHLTVYRDEITETYLYGVKNRLSILASKYGQDAIALTISEPILVIGA